MWTVFAALLLAASAARTFTVTLDAGTSEYLVSDDSGNSFPGLNPDITIVLGESVTFIADNFYIKDSPGVGTIRDNSLNEFTFAQNGTNPTFTPDISLVGETIYYQSSIGDSTALGNITVVEPPTDCSDLGLIGVPCIADNPCTEGDETCQVDLSCGGGTDVPAGTPCNDDLACTEDDACLAGECVGESNCPAPGLCEISITCGPTGECLTDLQPAGTACGGTGTCDSTGNCVGDTGCANTTCSIAYWDGTTCTYDNNTYEGASCDDDDACTTDDVCSSGVCVGTAVTCEAYACYEESTCDSETGECNYSQLAEGTSCDDNNGCTTNDVCDSNAVCSGTAITCTGSDGCTCSNSTGICSEAPDAYTICSATCGNDVVNGAEQCDGVENCNSDCKCAAGYFPGEDNECADLDECSAFNCGVGATCQQGDINERVCTCSDGFGIIRGSEDDSVSITLTGGAPFPGCDGVTPGAAVAFIRANPDLVAAAIVEGSGGLILAAYFDSFMTDNQYKLHIVIPDGTDLTDVEDYLASFFATLVGLDTSEVFVELSLAPTKRAEFYIASITLGSLSGGASLCASFALSGAIAARALL